MTTLFLSLMSLLSYAMGVVSVYGWRRRASPGAAKPVELLLGLAVVLGPTIARRWSNSPRYLPIWLLILFIVGLAVGAALLHFKNHFSGGTGEYDEEPSEVPSSLWKKWLNFSGSVVDYEFRLFLVACYLILIAPFAFLFRVGN